LRELELSFCKTLTNEVLSWILDRYIKLRKFSLTHCANLTEVTVVGGEIVHLEVVDSTFISKLKIGCTRLEYLNLSGCSGFTEEDITSILSKNNNLTNLNLRRVQQLTTLSAIASRSLQVMTLDRCKNLKELRFTHAPALQSLDISHTAIDDHMLYQIMNHEQLNQWSMIKEVKLEGCKSLKAPVIENQSVEKITFDFCSSLERPHLDCPSLELLSMSHTNVVDHALEYAVRNNERLKSLQARNNMRIVKPKIPASENHSIEELDLRGCHWLESVQIPAAASPARLTRIDLSLTRINDDTIRPVMRDCFALRDLSLKTCDFLVAPVIESESIETIDLSGSHALSSPSFRCSKVKEVRVENCKNLEAEAQRVIELMMNLNLATPTKAASHEKKAKGGTRIANVRRRLVF
jgi:hypothetical protein